MTPKEKVDSIMQAVVNTACDFVTDKDKERQQIQAELTDASKYCIDTNNYTLNGVILAIENYFNSVVPEPSDTVIEEQNQ